MSETPASSMPHVAKYVLLTLVVATSLVVVPFFTNFLVTGKLLILFLSATGLTSALIWKLLHRQSLELPKSPLLTPVFFFGLAVLASTLFATRYPVEGLLGMGGMYVSSALVVLAGSLLLRKGTSNQFVTVAAVTGAVISVLTLLQATGFGPSRLLNAAFGLDLPHTTLFNVAGSPFVAAQVLTVLLLGIVVSFFVRRQVSKVELASFIIMVVGLAVCVFSSLPGKPASPLLLPFGVSWSIAFDVMKTPRSALIGIGPENYSAAYSQFRPSWTNAQTWWGNLFGQGFNVPLTLLTTSGLLSLLAWMWLLLTFVSHARKNYKDEPFLTGLLAGSFLIQLFFPINVVLLVIQAVALAFYIVDTSSGRTLVHFLKTVSFEFGSASTRSAVATYLPIVIAATIFLASAYGIGRAYAASHYLYRSGMAAQRNDAVQMYDLQLKARNMNPYLALYRTNFASTNLAIASALANKTDITDQDRGQVSQLIQQAINEAKAATALRPDDTQGWRLLAQIYTNLIGSAEGADQWAVASYVRAIELHPADPTLRLELGSIFYAAQRYQEAALLFQQATELKPDYVNAYYNLANALKANNQLEAARTAYQRTLALLPADSEDYQKASQELSALEEQIKEAQPATTQQTTGAATNAGTSLLNQNLQSADEAVTQPAEDDLEVSDEAREALTASPAPSPSVLPSPSPTTP